MLPLDKSVEPLAAYRMPSVRGRAFLLFLAQLPRDAEVRRRRQERLANDDARCIAKLFPKASGEDPANRVIADPDEARMLRDALKTGQALPPGVAEEFAIPEEALGLPMPDAFLEARRRWLRAREEAFMDNRADEPRDIDLGDGRVYLDGGTWMDLMKLPALDDDAAVRAFVDRLEAGEVERIRRPTYVEVTDQGAALREWT